MSIAFDRIGSPRTPSVQIEENARGAVQGSSVRPNRVLLVGLLGSAATLAAATLYQVPDEDTGVDAVGEGSMLAHMVRSAFRQYPHAEYWVAGLANPSGTNASVDTVFSGAATAAGTVVLRVAGKKIDIPVAVGDSATDVGDAIDTEIALARNNELPVTSSNTTGTVTWTAKEDGVHGNYIRVSINRDASDPPIPAGLALTGGDEDQFLGSGATDADIDTALTAVGNNWFSVVVSGFADTTNHGKLQDWADGQWAPDVAQEVIAVAGTCDSYANTVTDGNAENSKLMVLAAPGLVPQTPWVVAAVVGARIAENWVRDPNRPMQRSYLLEAQGTLYGIDAPVGQAKFTASQIETLLSDGVAPISFDRVGKPQLVRVITTYQTNSAGVPDASYLDATTLLNLMNFFYQHRVRFLLRHPDSKLAADGTRFSPGQVVATPGSIRADMLELYDEFESDGLVQDAEGYADDLVVGINEGDPNRVDVLCKPRLVVGLRVIAIQVGFQLGA